jgi:ATP-dependent DNA helicase RecG
MTVIVSGKVDLNRGRFQMINPLVDLFGDQTGRVVPIYPQSTKTNLTVRSSELGEYVAEALSRAGDFADPLPPRYRSRLKLIDRTRAFSGIHQPQAYEDIFPARRRLSFDELWRLQLTLVLRKRAAAERSRGIGHQVDARGSEQSLVERFLTGLPFPLTSAQRRAIEEIATDLASSFPMHRLLQGDVGSGKTVVALATLLYGVQGGYQGALMVPTEVLAEQHYLSARDLLEGLTVPDPGRLTGERPIAVALLTSRTPGGERSRLIAELGDGGIDILVGTHALLTEAVRFSSLGIVVIDEQHRFGVDQRAALREKGSADPGLSRDPDLLVMTATPIPRTAAMTVYGDLDYSVLDELPPSRSPVATRWVATRDDEHLAWDMVRDEVAHGRQAFVVCALVRTGEASDEVDVDGLYYDLEDRDDPERLFTPPGAITGAALGATKKTAPRAAVEERDRLARDELVGMSVGLLHGQMVPREKEEVMSAFRRGDVDVLVATTVIEVGVDVPSATVMVIEDADRFGIAQLHQLRGRVGRGADRSYCFLLADEVTDDAAQRLEALEATNDGFALAEVDLDLRGEGTVLGARQKGRNDLKLASLRRDRELVGLAREVAVEMVAADPTLAANPQVLDELRLFIGEEEAEYLERS